MTLLLDTLPALGVVLAVTTVVWGASLIVRDVSIIDVFWGPLFALQSWMHRGDAPDPGLLADVAVALVTVWALRLAVHIARRARGSGEDPRYGAMRKAGGPGWAARSLATVFWLQGALAWIVAWPAAVAARSHVDPGVVGWIGAAVAAFGATFEAVADAQLTRFKTGPERRAGLLDRGLWRYSRHPNYFGDAVFWWGLWILSAAAGGAWTVFAPFLMTGLLMKVSGVPLVESRLEETRPGYRDYVRRTPAFVPWFPREPGPHEEDA